MLKSTDIIMALNATPLTTEGLKFMKGAPKMRDSSRVEFLRYCYVEPDFITSQSLLTKRLNLEGHIFPETYADDYEYRIRLKGSKFHRSMFIRYLLGSEVESNASQLMNTVFILEGPAGCGKTTYANKLICGRFNARTINIENATANSYPFMERTFDFLEVTPINALRGLFIAEIHEILTKLQQEEEATHRNRIKRLWDKYSFYFRSPQISFADSWEFNGFFQIMKKYAETHLSYNELSNQLFFYIKIMLLDVDHQPLLDCFEEADEVNDIDFRTLYSQLRSTVHMNAKSNNNVNGDKALAFLLGLIMRLNFSLSRIDEEESSNPLKRILFLDNFEKFIVNEQGMPFCNIYDYELQMIVTSIYSAANVFESAVINIFRQLSLPKYLTSFALLIALRETTVELVQSTGIGKTYFSQQQQDTMPTILNIANWFNFKDILYRKVAYFGVGLDSIRENRRKHSPKVIQSLIQDELNSNPILVALNNVMSDVSPSRWSLRNLLISLYNDDFRRFAYHLTCAFVNYEDEIALFNKLWSQSTRSPNSNSHITHVCRMLVLSVVLNYMQNRKLEQNSNVGFFDQLMLTNDMSSSDEVFLSSTILRRTLTLLDNREKDESRKEADKGISFPEIIRLIVHKRIERLSEERYSSTIIGHQIEDMAKVFEMASLSAMVSTNGVELINISIDRTKMEESSLADIMKSQWDSYLKDKSIDSSFRIRITKAGSAIAQILPCFEFFFCRYKQISIPLLLTRSEKDRMKLLFGDGDGTVSSIGKTRKDAGIVDRAFFCVDKSIQLEETLLSRGIAVDGATRNFDTPEWLYKNNRLSRGVVHAVSILVEHLNYLLSYRKYLSELSDTEKTQFDASRYSASNDFDESAETHSFASVGIVDTAITRYYDKLSTIIKEHNEYISLGTIPDKYPRRAKTIS